LQKLIQTNAMKIFKAFQTLLSINSRFYPPHKNKGDWWEGNLSVVLFGETLLTKEFKENTLEKLHDSVEKYLKHYVGCIKARL